MTCRVTGDGRSRIYPFLSPAVPSSGHVKWKNACRKRVRRLWVIPAGLWGGSNPCLQESSGLAEQLPAVPSQNMAGLGSPSKNDVISFLLILVLPLCSPTAPGCGPQGAATHPSPIPSPLPSQWLHGGQIQHSEASKAQLIHPARTRPGGGRRPS